MTKQNMTIFIGLIGGFMAVFFMTAFWFRSREGAVDSAEKDLVIRTLWAEAGKEPVKGRKAVLWVMRNRVGCYSWDSLTKVVTAKNQFEPWVYKKTRGRMQAFSDNYTLYQQWLNRGQNGRRRVSIPFIHFAKVKADWQLYNHLSRLYDDVMQRPKSDDPTKGSFYFENRAITKKRGRKSLCYGRKVRVIGHHSFCQAEKAVRLGKCKKNKI